MATQDSKNPNSIADVVDGLDELANSEDEVKIADVLDKFGARSFAPVMLVLALLEISPVGVIPGVPSFLAICVALIAVQMLVGRNHIWVPSWIAERSVSSAKMDKATTKLEGPAEKLDGVAKERLEILAQGPALKVAAAIIILLCLMVPPLEVLPWASAGPMLAISIICLAIMVRDGLAMLVAWILAFGAVGGLAAWYLGSDAAGSGFLPF
ncbi:hypothetical protein NAP1_11403 [Erythrobacter sp. NAP1]|uniref:exopolysaccharide biosynthesis protein n=1 Tax=Erythrobacter sp. NAP1 TaxID=237727 RepID=UPI00006877CC|nr:exopolysaccharide biosynthesis protein [Erythrobacter sp. NAP1]EAQ28198.1 hypothetical protein NAP1_11403 [Erythrobacter sp. NAP1]